jgi:hypothetical protein
LKGATHRRQFPANLIEMYTFMRFHLFTYRPGGWKWAHILSPFWIPIQCKLWCKLTTQSIQMIDWRIQIQLDFCCVRSSSNQKSSLFRFESFRRRWMLCYDINDESLEKRKRDIATNFDQDLEYWNHPSYTILRTNFVAFCSLHRFSRIRASAIWRQS